MRHILDIGHNDLRLFFKSRSVYIWLFALPLAFVYLTGFVNRGQGDPYNRRPPVVMDNQDTNFLGRIFLDELGAQGMRLLSPTNRDSARGLRVPPDFTARLLRLEPARVEFFKKEGSAESDAALVELRVLRAMIALNGHLLETGPQTNAAGPAFTEEKLRAVLAAPDPVTLNARFAGRKPTPSGFNFSLPGNLVMYLMMNLLMFGGSAVAAERRSGVMRRVLVHPLSRIEIVLGKIYGLVLLGTAQIVFFLLVGRFVFGVNLGANLPAVTLILLVFAWVAGSLGVLVGSLTVSEDRVAGICILASLLMAAIGGCWWPLEIGPPALKTAALCLPTGWAMQALHQVISFGSGFGAIVKPLVVLVGFGAAANLLAARFFRS